MCSSDLDNQIAQLQNALSHLVRARDALKSNTRSDTLVSSEPIIDRVINVLSDAGQPMKAADIFTALSASGKAVKKMSVLVELSRAASAGRLIRVSMGVYSLPPAA